MIETSSDLPRSSSAIFGNLQLSSENVRKGSSGLWKNIEKSSEIFGKWSKIFGKSSKTSSLVSLFIFSQEGTVTNPAIWLVLSAVRIFLPLTTVTVTAGNSAGEIVVLVNFREWTSGNGQPFPFLHLHRQLRSFLTFALRILTAHNLWRHKSALVHAHIENMTDLPWCWALSVEKWL